MAKRVAKVTPRTSRLTNFNKPYAQKGFSLIEILVVLGIIATLVGFGVTRLNFKQGNLKTTVRHLTVLSRELRQHARIKQTKYRIAFDLEADPNTYWVERFNPNPPDPEEEKKSDEPFSPYEKDDSLLKDEKKLPPGVKIKSVINTTDFKQGLDNKKGYIHFYASGVTDAAIIIVTQGTQTNSLIIQPLSGRAELVDKEVSLEDIIVK